MNQTTYFEGYEARVFSTLIDCRSDGSCEVSGGAESALRIFLSNLDAAMLCQIILDFIGDELKGGPAAPAVSMPDSIYTRPAVYQPSRACSAFEALGMVLPELEISPGVIEGVMRVCQRGLESRVLDCRRGAVVCLVGLGGVIGEERMWGIMEGELSGGQEKLVAVYFERVRRGGGLKN